MPLSWYEQQVLDEIETGVWADDPAFAAKLNPGPAGQDRRRRTVVAHGYLWLGMIMTLVGFGLVHDARAAGALLVLCGVGTLIAALVRLWRLHPIDGWQRVRRSGSGSAAPEQ